MARQNLVETLAMNQVVTTDPVTGNESFYSYGVLLASIDHEMGHIFLDEVYWDYSKTTMKWLTKFLGDKSAKEVRAKVKSGKYVIGQLNEWY